MDLPRTLYVKFNGSPVAVVASVEHMNNIIDILSSRGVVSLEETPAHHEDNFRIRFIPEISDLIGYSIGDDNIVLKD